MASKRGPSDAELALGAAVNGLTTALELWKGVHPLLKIGDALDEQHIGRVGTIQQSLDMVKPVLERLKRDRGAR